MSQEPDAGSTSGAGCDTSDMILVHGLLRHVYQAAPELIAQVPDGDTVRAGAVADHLEFLNRFLHNHHRSEDLVLWDELAARSPGCALHVGLMKRQHEGVADVIGRMEPVIASWRSSGSTADRERIGELLQELNGLLFHHLGDEETRILPVISATWTQEEWERLGKHAQKGMQPKQLMVVIGFMLESMTPEQRDELLRSAPKVMRVVYRLYGRRVFRSYRSRAYGLTS
ncbi:hemerythrin domain-containing protein [Naasia sp. SYSU D00948]|uniref:hemerythrin domain-containing protein n=1 Tax=Naasia sp. SYSU D00948 TaxID=2817379 RepID=UPI001B30E8A8|nr:hemerythrin domain-containing protein [Naasia sp. SYSU D00948]